MNDGASPVADQHRCRVNIIVAGHKIESFRDRECKFGELRLRCAVLDTISFPGQLERLFAVRLRTE